MAHQAGVSPDELNIAVEVILPSNFAELKARADQQRTEAARLTTKAQESTQDLAMRKSGMTVRDMGEILGVSYQRAQNSLPVGRTYAP